MKLVVAGSRHYTDYFQAKQYIHDCIHPWLCTETLIILSGGCRGADQLGERYAAEHEIPVERYLPDWKIYGKGAGPKRNRAMIDACDAVICFWDGESRGTKSLIAYARKMKKSVYIKHI